ncbi:TonB-dependent receptor [Pedobacter lusitanus]|uniref:TonB-dependent receptor n=1 Tax=Pedobacter lusitanus TaxID=1503925 RepID=A0A0D0GVV3_9SPHI|nr:TonB-dependent receptor [Pedobacter lusitanus]KIO78586.1 TonB-dependent receptor [Pedobacter lusitanus]
MRFLYTTLLLFNSIIGFAQVTGSITGKISLVDGQSAGSVAVSIVELHKNTLTDDHGNYSFNKVIPGKYIIRIQMLGAAQQDLSVTVIAGKTIKADYQLNKENVQALQEVTIGGTANKFSKKESVYAARLPLKNLENPQVYISIPKALIQEQLAVDLGSISKNVPGSGIPMLANQGRVTFRSRGFETEPMVRNGVAGFAYTAIDPANLERIEAIKGPSATLFGTNLSSYGGLFNRVTKKPYNGVGGEVSLFGGSWDYKRMAFDINTPLNADKTVLFRLNGAGTYENSFQDAGFTKSFSVAPSFSYQITDKLSMLFDVEYGQAEGTSVVRFNPYTKNDSKVEKVKIRNIRDMNFPYDQLFGNNDLAYRTQMVNIFAQFNYKMSEKWTSQTVMSRSSTAIRGYISALNGVSDTQLSALVMRGYTSFIATDIQQNFTGDFKIGSHRNRVVLGLDFYNNTNTFDRVHVTGPVVNFVNPAPGSGISKKTIDDLAPTKAGKIRNESNADNSYAVYASDVFNINDRLLAMLSLRLDRFQADGVTVVATDKNTGAYGQTALSPKLGLVYQLIKDKISLFGSYMNSFTNKSGADINGNVFKPEQANQLETGIKADIFDHKLVGTISYYDIKVKDMLRDDLANPTYQIQDGNQKSRGVEIELTANPFPGFNIIAGYAYNDSKFIDAAPSVEGLRPALSGPDKMINFWLSYKFPAGQLKGFGAGFGGNSGSSSYQTNTTTSKIIIPGYTMFDATVFYDQRRFRIGVKVDNLTSEKAWSVRLTPQSPARYMANLTVRF